MNNVVLIITADTEGARELQNGLAAARDGPFDVVLAGTLAEGVNHLGSDQRIDIILLDLFLPDSQGVATFDRLHQQAGMTPILIVSPREHEPAAMEAVQHGAQAYLSKGYYRNAIVPQALRSIIQRRAIEAALFAEKEKSRIILEAVGEGVLSTDMAGSISYLNPVAEAMTGWERDEACGHAFSEVAQIIDGASREPVWDHLRTAIGEDRTVQGVAGMLLVRRDGQEAPVEMSVAPLHERDGKLSGAVVVLHDASAAQAASYKKLTYLAEHDFLTKLPNRFLLNDRISQAISHAAREGSRVAVLFLDLDNFKSVNDSLGHAVGDRLLQAVAQRLSRCVRHSDTVSRQGGDEFIVVTDDEHVAEDARHAAEKILNEFAAPFQIGQHQLQVTTSIGISVYPEDGADADTLLKNADTAMYHAKNHGRDNYQFFNSDMNVRAIERQTLEAHLRNALRRNEFELYYQPKVSLHSGAITGAEALLRWRHAQRGIVLPNHFVGIAEDSGLITPIGRWVLREACCQAKRWVDAGIDVGSIAVNVSASEFRGRGFLDGVRAVLIETGLDGSKLELELTESVLMRDAESSRTTLHALKAMGVRLVVDDFGTGYSSLAYLQQFPIDVLKIDQSFVMGIEPESGNNIIVSAVVGMGRNLKLHVVAEGVETREQCQFLQSRQCDEGQGYYFSEPLAADAFVHLMQRGIAADAITHLS